MWLPSYKIYALIIILSFAGGLISTSCEKEERPADLLPQDQLTKIMIDFYLGEARLVNAAIPRDSAIKLLVPFKESVFKKYGVPDSSFHRTYQYYYDHPVELEKIYEAVIDSLSLRERKASSTPPPVK